MQFLTLLAAALLPAAIMAAPAAENKVEKRCCDDSIYWTCVANTALVMPCDNYFDCAAKGNCLAQCGGGSFCSLTPF